LGIDTGGGTGIAGNDVISNISLGAGAVVTGNTFGEVFPILTPVTPEGAAGNPPVLPGFLPANLAPIGNQTSFGAPGQIYSGIPINQNSDPLSLDSGRRVLGGFSVSDGFFAAIQPVIEEGCGCGPVYTEGAVPGAIEGQTLGPVIEQTPEGFFEGASSEQGDGDQEGEADQVEEESIVKEDSGRAPAPSFLKRMSSWIITPTDHIES